MGYFTDDQAKEIWKAKWKGSTVQSLIVKYGENQFRLYEVWSGRRNIGTLEAAYEELKLEDPALATRITPTLHVQTRRIVSKVSRPNGQLDMFNPI